MKFAMPNTAVFEPTFTMRPRPAARIGSEAALEARKAVRRLLSTMRSQVDPEGAHLAAFGDDVLDHAGDVHHVGAHDGRATTGQPLRGPGADAATGTGHHRDLPFEVTARLGGDALRRTRRIVDHTGSITSELARRVICFDLGGRLSSVVVDAPRHGSHERISSSEPQGVSANALVSPGVSAGGNRTGSPMMRTPGCARSRSSVAPTSLTSTATCEPPRTSGAGSSPCGRGDHHCNSSTRPPPRSSIARAKCAEASAPSRPACVSEPG